MFPSHDRLRINIKLEKKFKKLNVYSERIFVSEANRAIANARAMAVSDAPVAESYGGTLKQSIRIKPVKGGGEMYSTVDYAPYVEFGTGSGYLKVNDATKLGIPEKFIKQFQLKLLNSLNKQKTLKIDMLYNHLTKKCKYSHDQVVNFFDSIDIDIYRPFIGS